MVDHSSRGELWPEPGSEDGTRCRPWRDAARDQIHCPCVARPTDDQLPEETSSQAVSRKDRACRLIWLVRSQLGGSEPRSRAVNVTLLRQGPRARVDCLTRNPIAVDANRVLSARMSADCGRQCRNPGRSCHQTCRQRFNPRIGSAVPSWNFPSLPEIISYDDPTRPI